jgi:hypothetical protein
MGVAESRHDKESTSTGESEEDSEEQKSERGTPVAENEAEARYGCFPVVRVVDAGRQAASPVLGEHQLECDMSISADDHQSGDTPNIFRSCRSDFDR